MNVPPGNQTMRKETEVPGMVSVMMGNAGAGTGSATGRAPAQPMRTNKNGLLRILGKSSVKRRG